ncbi:hypothetical protein B7P34_00520 [Streptosporangium nondiastaticum]|uniref:Uncharacterized protein n=1 Tax=Streptosporangium nondiastaticum TaxID=35764 RepID=A0A9X7JVB3_9ACTN|nr:hypothetical protein B7P34_00520 [Streptosporangium nondiastaticum]
MCVVVLHLGLHGPGAVKTPQEFDVDGESPEALKAITRRTDTSSLAAMSRASAITPETIIVM